MKMVLVQGIGLEEIMVHHLLQLVQIQDILVISMIIYMVSFVLHLLQKITIMYILKLLDLVVREVERAKLGHLNPSPDREKNQALYCLY